MILLDTHALLWWTLDPERLSARAVKECARLQEEGGCISSISIWEIGIKLKNKKLDIGMDIGEYASRVKMLPMLEIVPVDESIWVESLMLEWENRDPADRVIVATAIKRRCSLVSRDEKIARFYKKTIW